MLSKDSSITRAGYKSLEATRRSAKFLKNQLNKPNFVFTQNPIRIEGQMDLSRTHRVNGEASNSQTGMIELKQASYPGLNLNSVDIKLAQD